MAAFIFSIYFRPRTPGLLLLISGLPHWFSSFLLCLNHLGSLKKAQMSWQSFRLIESQSPNLKAGGWTPEFFKSSLIKPLWRAQSALSHSLSESPQARCEFAHHPWGEGYADGWTIRVFTSSVGGTSWLIENLQFLGWEVWVRPGSVYDAAVPSAGNGTLNS